MAGNNEFFEALTMLEHERGITAEYLVDKIKAAIVIAVKKNYDVEDDNVSVEIDPAAGVFNVALVQVCSTAPATSPEVAKAGMLRVASSRIAVRAPARIFLFLFKMIPPFKIGEGRVSTAPSNSMFIQMPQQGDGDAQPQQGQDQQRPYP